MHSRMRAARMAARMRGTAPPLACGNYTRQIQGLKPRAQGALLLLATCQVETQVRLSVRPCPGGQVSRLSAARRQWLTALGN
jgi:hypothetical protein